MSGKIITWNVFYMNSLKRDIVSLQETHIKKSDWKYLINKHLGLEFSHCNRTKAIVCYINKKLQPKILYYDNEGRHLAIEISYNRKKHLLSKYMPLMTGKKNITMRSPINYNKQCMIK